MQTASRYLLEQKSETTDPEKHFLEEGGKGLDLAEERLWLWSQAQQAPTQGEGHDSRLCTGPTAHLPGSGIWRLPLLSTSSRGGRGCPASASTGQKVGVLKHMGGHMEVSKSQACYQWGTGAGRGQALVPKHLQKPGNSAVLAQTEPRMEPGFKT